MVRCTADKHHVLWCSGAAGTTSDTVTLDSGQSVRQEGSIPVPARYADCWSELVSGSGDSRRQEKVKMYILHL